MRHFLLPEKTLIGPDKFQERFFNSRLTKYDSTLFFFRLINLVDVAKDFFEQKQQLPPVHLDCTSLHLMGANGICAKIDERAYLTFLNEGLFHSVPRIFEALLPHIDANLFGVQTIGTIEVLPKFLIFSYLNDIRSGKWKEKYLGAFTHSEWFVKSKPKKQGESYEDDFKTYSTSVLLKQPLNREGRFYYANQGAFMFLIAHEFSHAYRNHLQQIKSGKPLRGKTEVSAANLILEKYGHSPEETAELLADGTKYQVNQVVEHEADTDAINAVMHYGIFNELSDERMACLLHGALAIHLIAEIHRRVVLITRFGKDFLQQELALDDQYKNIIYDIEHPLPFSRLTHLLPEIGSAEFSSFQATDIALNCIKRFDEIWPVFMDGFSEIETEIQKTPFLQNSPEHIFEGLNGIGFSDICHLPNFQFLNR